MIHAEEQYIDIEQYIGNTKNMTLTEVTSSGKFPAWLSNHNTQMMPYSLMVNT